MDLYFCIISNRDIVNDKNKKDKGIIAISVLFLVQSFSMQSAEAGGMNLATQLTKKIELLEESIGLQVAQIQREGSSSQLNLSLLRSQFVELGELLNQKITSYSKHLEDILKALKTYVGNQQETQRLNQEFLASDARLNFFKAKLARLKDQVLVVSGAAAIAAPAVVAMAGRQQAWQDYGQPAYQPGGAAAMAAPAAVAESLEQKITIKRRGVIDFDSDNFYALDDGSSLRITVDGNNIVVAWPKGYLSAICYNNVLNKYMLKTFLKGFENVSIWHERAGRLMTHQEIKAYILSCLSTVIDIDQATLKSFLE